jgi:hypothetical protein
MEELELVLRGGRAQQRRSTNNRFTIKKQQRFLDALAHSCNVALSAEYADVSTFTVYQHRLRDPAFRALWQEAIAAGYDRLEGLLLEHGGAAQPLGPPDGERAADADPRPFDFDRALTLLRQYQARREGKPTGGARRNATREETNAALLKAIEGVRRRIEREAERGNGRG